MKPASANLANLLVGPNQASQLIMADLYLFTLADGTILRWTSFDTDITYLGNTFLSLHSTTGVAIRRGPITERSGVQTSPLTIYVSGNSIVDLGLTVHQAVVAGLFNGATCTLYRTFWKINPTVGFPPLNPDGSIAQKSDRTYNATDAVNKFTGWVSQCEAGRSMVVFTISSLFERLNIPSPWTVLQPSCRWTLFDTGCGLLASSFAVNGTALAGSTQKVINHSVGGTYPRDYFALGRVQFTSGLNNGLWRMVQVGDIAGVTRSFSDLVIGLKPLGYWRLGEASGTAIADSSGNGNTGTLHGGVTLAQTGGLTGDASTGALFDGSTGYATLPMPAPPNFSQGISFSFLFKLNASPPAAQPLGIFDSSPGTINTLRNYNPPGPGPGMEWRNQRPTVTFTQPSASVWHLGCVVFRGQNALDVYLDGVFQSSITAEGPGLIDWTNPMIIGALTALGGAVGSIGWFAGFLQEFAVYDFALDPTIVAALYQSMKNAPATSVASLVLVQPLPHAPVVGDTFTVYPGCDKTLPTCIKRFGNKANFGGAPFAPQPANVV